MASGLCAKCQGLHHINPGKLLPAEPNGGGLPTRAREWLVVHHKAAVHPGCPLHIDTRPLPSEWICAEHGKVDPLSVEVVSCTGSGKPV